MKEPLRVTAVKGHDISTYRLSSGRYMTVWYDADGQRQRRSRATLKEADELAREVSDALRKKVNGAMTLDDRQAYNLARDLAEPFGYTVLQAVREWERSKAPYRGKKTAEVIAELIAAKRREQLSNPYVNRLEDDLKSFAAAVPDEIEKVQAPHIKEFLNGCEVGPRRWNNLRDQIVTLFRFARSERYLPKERTTEAEDVTKMKVARKTVAMFTPEELQLILENAREVWLPWVLISAFAGVRTFEVLRMDWSCVRWDQRLINLPPEVTKVNERRIIPMCEALMKKLSPWRDARGPVCEDKVPQREIEQILAKARMVRPDFHWKYNALRHASGSYRTALTQNVPQVALEMGNSVGMVKRHYLEAKTFEEGLRWFQVAWPVAAKKRASDPFLRWVAAAV
ncbi:MAG TPA: site-specific integrase [Chthoniobacterales bacterium]